MQGLAALHLAGALLLPLCGWLAGNAVQARASQHTDTLRQVISLLQRIRQEIAFRQADLEQINRLLQQENFDAVLFTGISLQNLPAPESLSNAERHCFTECMAGLGRTEAKQECERLDYYTARFQEYLQQACQLQSREAGLPRRLGFAAGAVLALVFL